MIIKTNEMVRLLLCSKKGMQSDDAAGLETRLGAVTLNEPKVSRPTKTSTVDQMRAALAALGVSIKGKKETLYKRWITEHKRAETVITDEKRGNTPGPDTILQPKQKNNFFLCFDVEATCSPGVDFKYPNEIIEFPVVLLHWVADDETTTFQRYVKPTWQPKLSEFCTTLTGIQQSTVDQAKPFPEMLLEFEQWLSEQSLLDEDRLREDAIWVTDGRWDLSDFIQKQLFITPLPAPRKSYPPYLRAPILNIKHGVRDVLEDMAKPTHGPLHTRRRRKGKEQPPRGLTLKDQLDKLGLGAFEGRQHSGIDDAANIARIVAALADLNVQLEANYTLPALSSKRAAFDWMGDNGEVIYPPRIATLTSTPPAVAAGEAENPQIEGEQGKDA